MLPDDFICSYLKLAHQSKANFLYAFVGYRVSMVIDIFERGFFFDFSSLTMKKSPASIMESKIPKASVSIVR